MSITLGNCGRRHMKICGRSEDAAGADIKERPGEPICNTKIWLGRVVTLHFVDITMVAVFPT